MHWPFARTWLAMLLGVLWMGAVAAADETGAVGPVEAPTAETSPTEKEVERLIEQLGDAVWETRQQAEQRLMTLGSPAVERLRIALETTQIEEVRTRATRALRKLESQERARPTLVTLTLQQVTVTEAIQALAKAGGVEIAVWPPHRQPGRGNAKRVSLKLDRQPFWLAIRALCQQAELTPQRMGGQTQITLMQNSSGWSKKPYHMHGGFLVQASQIQRTHHIDFASPGTVRHNFSIQLSVFVDPRRNILRGSRLLTIEEAIDEKGNSLVKLPPQRLQPSLSAPSYGGAWLWEMQAALEYQPNLGSKLAKLRGTMTFEAEQEREVWEVKDVAATKDASRTIGSVTYRFAGLNSRGSSYQTKLLIEYPSERQPGSDGVLDYQTVYSHVRLFDAAGNAYHTAGGSGGGGGGTLRYELHFQAQGGQAEGGQAEGNQTLGEPDRLVWTIPISTETITVPVEFQDLPIP